ncbi:MAG TPA: hypothetical protein VMC07_01775 [Candidatus Omnitrophota bacterium]|nr:hypothetical protein [Candidatus Omnitrophota bacterium]
MPEGYRRDFVDHLKRTLSKGYKEDILRIALINQGYADVIIDRAMEQAKKELADEESARDVKEKPEIKVEIFDEKNRLVNPLKKSFWKRLFGK